MARNTNRVASAFAYVAALGLAFGASAAHWELSTNGEVTYASEIFGADAATLELTLETDDTTTTEFNENEGTYVDLALLVPNGTVNTNSEITVTVTLNGATFGNTVQINDFSSRGTGLSIVNGSKKDGRVGDRSVSVGYKATGEIGQSGPDATDDNSRATIRLTLSSIEGATGLATPKSKVTASASVELVGTAGANMVDFPTDVTPPGVRNNPETDDEGIDESMDKDGKPVFKPADNVIAQSVQSYDYGATDGGMGPITLDDRTKIKGAQVALATLTRTFTLAQVADNDDTFDGAGNVKVGVSGDKIAVNDDDIVFYDLDADKKMTENELLDVADGGASGTFRSTPATVYYVPGGEEDLKAGMLTATFNVEFDSTSSVNPGEEEASGMLIYDGVSEEARAYAIPNPARIDDVGNVRIRCEAGKACTVFLSCDGQDGTDYFGEVGEIEGGATMVLQSQGIADMLGADDGWMGRLSCDVLSSGDATVQVLVRSGASNVLVNNTYVDDNAVAEMLSTLSSAVEDVETAIDDVKGVVDTISTNNPKPPEENGN